MLGRTSGTTRRSSEQGRFGTFTSMGTRVAAVNVSSGPLLLLAGHRPAPSVLPVFEVEDLKATIKEFKSRGWQPDGDEFEIPNGPCYLFKAPQRKSDGHIPGCPSQIVGERIPRDRLARQSSKPPTFRRNPAR